MKRTNRFRRVRNSFSPGRFIRRLRRKLMFFYFKIKLISRLHRQDFRLNLEKQNKNYAIISYDAGEV